MIKLFEAFSGYGSQHMALKKICNVESVGISEIDPDVIVSYAAIHHTKRFEELYSKGVKDISQAKIWLKSRNIGFDFSKNKSSIDRMSHDKINRLVAACVASKNYGDISLVNKKKLSDSIDIFTYSFPCQDISVAGKMQGLSEDSGTRSSLLWQCKEFIEINKPKFLLMENVKNLVGKKFINDYNLWLEELEKLGYKNYWKVLNAKDYGVPQNRERVFCVSIREDVDLEYIFPKPIKLGKRLKDALEDNVDDKYYYNNERANELIRIIINKYNKKTIIPCDSTLNQPKELEVSNCITARYDAGIQNQRSIGVAIVEPIIEPQQFRLGGIFDDEKGKHQAGSVWDKDGLAPTLDTMQGGWRQPMITDEFKIRKLTPRECWRLMGVSDKDFDQAEKHNSNSSLYKQAGNSIVVDVLEHLFKNLIDNNN